MEYMDFGMIMVHPTSHLPGARPTIRSTILIQYARSTRQEVYAVLLRAVGERDENGREEEIEFRPRRCSLPNSRTPEHDSSRLQGLPSATHDPRFANRHFLYIDCQGVVEET
jgi:hypothetical protein